MFSVMLAVAILHWAVLVIPGANVLVVSSLAADGARTAACFAGFGVTAVATIWSTLAVLGVNAVFAAHPYLRVALQIAGGVYLLYVAARLWRVGSGAGEAATDQLTPLAAFRLGFLTNIMNPKSALFFGSVFATALPHEPSAPVLLGAVLVVFVNALVWHLILAFAFSHHRVQATYARQRTALSRLAGALVGVFGLRLFVTAVSEVRLR